MAKGVGFQKEIVLVSGGAGYIGSHAVLALAEAGYEPLVVDNLSSGSREAVLAGQLVVADIGDAAEVAGLIVRFGIRTVLHFAASIEVEESIRDPFKYYENNSMRSLSLVRTAVENGVENFVFSSTAAVYGIPGRSPVNEEEPLRPINPYGASKMATELLLRDVAAARSGFRFAALRYFNVAGADRGGRIGQRYAHPTHLITMALQAALGRRSELRIFGDDYDTADGTAVRDYIDVEDLVAAHLLAMDFLRRERCSRVFNCGYGRGYSVLEVVAAVQSVTGVDFPGVRAARRPGDPPRLVADAGRLRTELGWRPGHERLEEIIASAWAWEKSRMAAGD
jgi:UDP-glucose 4-epimerase